MSEISYFRSGNLDGDLIVWLHGGGLDGEMWNAQIQHFSDYDNIVMDLPDHGDSKNMIFTMPSVAELLYAIIERHRGDKKVYAVGFSLGAQVLVEYISLYPEHIDKAVINSALVIPMPFVRKMAKLMGSISVKLVWWNWFMKIQAKQLYISEAQYPHFLECARGMGKKGYARIMSENARYQLPESFSESKTGVFLLYGAKEPKVMKKSFEKIRESRKDVKAKIVEGIGHGISLANPDLFNRLVRIYLETGEVE